MVVVWRAISPAVLVGSVITLGGLVLIVGEHEASPTGPPEDRRRGLALAVLAAVAWAASATLMRPPLKEIDPLTIQAVRLPLTTLVLWATPWARGTFRGLWAQREAVWPQVLALGALTALSAIAFLVGLKHGGVALGTVLSSTAPLFALPIGLLAYGERVTWRATIGALLCIGGIGVLSL